MTRADMITRLAELGIAGDRRTGNGTRIDSRSDDYLAERLKVAEEDSPAAAHAAMVAERRNAWRGDEAPIDAAEGESETALEAHAAMTERNRNAWKTGGAK